MSQTAPAYAGTVVNNPGGSYGNNPWTNPGNAGVEDGTFATNATYNGDGTQGLLATNFGLSVPAGSTINGIEVQVKCFGSGGFQNTEANSVMLVKSGAAVGTDHASDGGYYGSLPASTTYITYGGPSDLWGLALATSDVNASNFGVRWNGFVLANGAEIWVDAIRIVVFYTIAPAETARIGGTFQLAAMAVPVVQETGGTGAAFTVSAVAQVSKPPMSNIGGTFTVHGSPRTAPPPYKPPKPPPPGQFNYHSFDLLTGAYIGSTPMRANSFGSLLNSPQQGTFTFDLMDPGVIRTNPVENTRPCRTLLVVDYEGALLWGGPVLTRRPVRDASTSSTTNTVQVQASEPWAWLGGRVQATDYSAPPYSGINPTGMGLWARDVWDAGLIACQVIVDALGYSQNVINPFSNILGGLAVLYNGALPSGASPQIGSGDWINVTYPFTSLQTLDTIVSQLAQLGLGVGFDYAVDLAYSAGPGSRPFGTVNIDYPRRGRSADQSGLVIDLSLARTYSFPEDGTQAGNQVYEMAGQGAIVVSTNATPLDQGYPLWERVISRSAAQSANLMQMLAQVGESDLAMYSYPSVTPSVTLGLFDPNVGLTEAGLPFTVGDDARVYLPATASDGSVFDPRFPAGLDEEWRIVGWTVTPGDEGDSTLQLDLAQPPYEVAIASAV